MNYNVYRYVWSKHVFVSLQIVEDVETQSKFDENQANYKLKITGE